jgi:hypothetical protein
LEQHIHIYKDGKKIDTKPAKERQRIEEVNFSMDIGPFEKGEYTMEIVVTDLFGQTINKQHAFTVAVAPPGIESMLKIGGLVVGVGYIALFGVLVICAHWSPQCLTVLTDPVWRKAWLYFGVAMRINLLKLWVFEQYFQRLKANATSLQPLRPSLAHAYIPVGLTRTKDGSTVLTDQLLDEYTHVNHLWVQGAAGRGKTALISKVVDAYLQAPSLYRAWKRYGFILIVVTVRNYSGHVPEAGQAWVTEMARAAFVSARMPFGDPGFFARLLEGGGFLLILDGLNEAGQEEACARYAALTPQVKLLVTSQTYPPGANETILLYELPGPTEDFVTKLLAAMLEEPQASEIVQALPLSLFKDWSGYEIQLIAELAKATPRQPLPTDRITLYESILARVRGEEQAYPDEVICRMAWQFWKSHTRRFAAEPDLTDRLLRPLLVHRIVVPRGKEYEFRHDLMQGYLAARWMAWHTVSVVALFQRLDDEVWRLSRAEQTLVFPFLTDLIAIRPDWNNKGTLQRVDQYARADIELRLVLFKAVQATARHHGWEPVFR